MPKRLFQNTFQCWIFWTDWAAAVPRTARRSCTPPSTPGQNRSTRTSPSLFRSPFPVAFFVKKILVGVGCIRNKAAFTFSLTYTYLTLPNLWNWQIVYFLNVAQAAVCTYFAVRWFTLSMLCGALDHLTTVSLYSLNANGVNILYFFYDLVAVVAQW